MHSAGLKQRVKDHWEGEVCGSRYGATVAADRKRFFATIDRERYLQDYMLMDFARFEEAFQKRVLEIGLGTGADFVRWVRAGGIGYGWDLTHEPGDLTPESTSPEGLTSDASVGGAESRA